MSCQGFSRAHHVVRMLLGSQPDREACHTSKWRGALVPSHQQLLAIIIACVHEHGGDVVKFAGDAVLCIFELVDDTERRQGGMRAAVVRAARVPRHCTKVPRVRRVERRGRRGERAADASFMSASGAARSPCFILGWTGANWSSPDRRCGSVRKPSRRQFGADLRPSEAWEYIYGEARGQPMEEGSAKSAASAATAVVVLRCVKKAPRRLRRHPQASILAAAFGPRASGVIGGGPSQSFMRLDGLPSELVATCLGELPSRRGGGGGGGGARSNLRSSALFIRANGGSFVKVASTSFTKPPSFGKDRLPPIHGAAVVAPAPSISAAGAGVHWHQEMIRTCAGMFPSPSR